MSSWKVIPWSVFLEYLQQLLQIFVLFGEWIVIFSFYIPTFTNTLSTDSRSQSLSYLNIISSFILYSFFIIIYFSYIYSQQLYFLMKSVIFTTFFAILSQQNLCRKLLLILILTHYWNYFFFLANIN